MRTEIFEHDRSFLPQIVAGADEVGRGPLAGPVVVACVIMPLDIQIDRIYDSKKVSEKNREMLYDIILAKAIEYKISIISEKVIDDVNILQATRVGFNESINAITKADICLVDAIDKLSIAVPYKSIIKGDMTSYNIAAASILAKVTRDRLMVEYDKMYPQYGFSQHKGYGTAKHIEALREFGPCAIHRTTFIKNFCK